MKTILPILDRLSLPYRGIRPFTDEFGPFTEIDWRCPFIAPRMGPWNRQWTSMVNDHEKSRFLSADDPVDPDAGHRHRLTEAPSSPCESGVGCRAEKTDSGARLEKFSIQTP